MKPYQYACGTSDSVAPKVEGGTYSYNPSTGHLTPLANEAVSPHRISVAPSGLLLSLSTEGTRTPADFRLLVARLWPGRGWDTLDFSDVTISVMGGLTVSTCRATVDVLAYSR